MSEFHDSGFLSWYKPHNSVTVGAHLNVYLELQRSDTILPTANVPVNAGDFYYGIHVRKLEPDMSTVCKLTSELRTIGLRLQEHAQQQESSERPSQVVGVTYLGLARLAGRLGFNYSEVPKEIFYSEENARVGWLELMGRIKDVYENDTEKGRKQDPANPRQALHPLRIGVLHQSLDRLVNVN
jgi:hypothetical protein